MPTPGNANYPPRFSQNAVSSTISEIDELSGPEEQGDGSEETTASLQTASLSRSIEGGATTDRAPVPVILIGTRAPFNNRFPGLREALIASAIVQIAEQIPESSADLRKSIIDLAEKLHRAGAEKILRNKIVRKPTERAARRSKAS